MNIVIDKELQSRIPPLSESEFTQLEKNILEHGCRDPLVIWKTSEGNVLLDGHNRYAICTKHGLGYQTKAMELESKEQALEWIDKNQIGRRNLHPEAFKLILGRIYNRTKSQGKRNDLTSCQSGTKLQAADRLAEEYNSSPRTVKRAGKAEEAVRGSPLEPAVLAGEARLNEAAELATAMREIEPEAKTYTLDEARKKIRAQEQAERERRRAEREQRIAEQIKKNPEKAAQGKFELVLADPPWQYDFAQSDSRHLDNHYPTTGVEEIIKHKPQTADDCVLLLWATVAKLPEALEVMKGWGFEYKTNAVWDKEKIGMGYWFRGQHELLLVGTKGTISPPEQDKRVSSVFIEARGRHSKKPECVYEWIEEAFPHLAKLEMYCREPREGWTAWGNEV